MNEVVQGQGAPQQSFRERKQAQLDQESAATPIEEDTAAPGVDPDQGAPLQVVESNEDVEQDDSQGLYADEEDDQDDLEGSSEDLEDETPSDEDQELEDGNVDWEKRYKDLQSETQADREARDEMNLEHAQAMSQVFDVTFQMEDALDDAVSAAETMFNAMSGNAQQFENINWNAVAPDKIGELQQRAQQALAMKQQAGQALQYARQQREEQLGKQRRREAMVAQSYLKRRVPGWSKEMYDQTRRDMIEHFGMPEQYFNSITNGQVLEALHLMTNVRSRGTSEVRTEQKRKSSAPRGKSKRRQPKDSRGRFMTTKTEPNQRGSFASRHQHRLEAEGTYRGR